MVLISNSLRHRLKAKLPRFITSGLRGFETYISRIGYWLQVMREVRGRTKKDNAKLWVSFLAASVVSMRNLDKWQNPMVLWDITVRVLGVGIFNVRANCDDLYHVIPSGEPEVFAAISRLLDTGGSFVDAGANIGKYSILAANRVGLEGRVIAIEMMPETALILRNHVEVNGARNIKVIEKALSDRAGETVTASVPENLHGQASISEELLSQNRRTISVETSTLDTILQGKYIIDLMKMDLEGVEPRALLGAEKSLQRIQNIIFEDWGKDGSETRQILKKHGYKISALDERNFLARREPVQGESAR